jgi:hypothetical protein
MELLLAGLRVKGLLDVVAGIDPTESKQFPVFGIAHHPRYVSIQ